MEKETCIIERLDKILEMFNNVQQEDIIDIRQSYKNVSYTIGVIGHEYNNISKAVQSIKDEVLSIKNEVVKIKYNIDKISAKNSCEEIKDKIIQDLKFNAHKELPHEKATQKKSSDNETLKLDKDVLTSEEVVKYLGISKSYLYKLTMMRQIPHYKPLGKFVYFSKKELDKWILTNRISTEDEINQKAQEYLNKKKIK